MRLPQSSQHEDAETTPTSSSSSSTTSQEKFHCDIHIYMCFAQMCSMHGLFLTHRYDLEREGDEIAPSEGKRYNSHVGVDVGLAAVVQKERVHSRTRQRGRLFNQAGGGGMQNNESTVVRNTASQQPRKNKQDVCVGRQRSDLLPAFTNATLGNKALYCIQSIVELVIKPRLAAKKYEGTYIPQ